MSNDLPDLPRNCTGTWTRYRGEPVIHHVAHCAVHDIYGPAADAQYRAIDRRLERPMTPAERRLIRTGPGWWTCNECGVEWPGPNY